MTTSTNGFIGKGGGGRGGGGGHFAPGGGGGRGAMPHHAAAPLHPHPHPPPHHGGRGRRGWRVYYGGSWWAWYPTGWIEVSPSLVCQDWGPPLVLTASRDLVAYATQALADAGGVPVSERLSDGWLYLFMPTEDGSLQIYRCWLDQGGAVGSTPPRPPGAIGQPPSSGTIGDQAPPTPPAVVVRPHPRGMDGVRAGAEEICRRIVQGARSELIIRWARQKIQEANIDQARGYPQPDKVVAALFKAWKAQVAFIKDPVNTELMIGAVQLLCLEPNGSCIPAGDCDDQLIGLGSAILSCGIPVWIRIRRYKGQNQAHVVLLYDSAPRMGGPVKCLDPSIEDGVCSDAPYLEEIIMEPDSGEDSDHGVFVGIGQAPGTIGDPPPAMPPQQVAAIRSEAMQLQAAAERLRRVSALHQVVAGAAPSAPLHDYLLNGRWTADARNAEAMVLQTATFLDHVLADALSGVRSSVLLPSGDLAITMQPGDAYGVMALPDASGQLHAWYIDAQTGTPAGFIGAAAVAPDPYATSLWAVVVVRRLLDALGKAHAQDTGTAGTIGDIGPGDVLSYRALWNDYVLQTVCAYNALAWALGFLIQGQPIPATIDVTALPAIPYCARVIPTWTITGPLVDTSQFGDNPPTVAELTSVQAAATASAAALLDEWNVWSGLSDYDIVQDAPQILTSYQGTVTAVGTTDRPYLSKYSPSLGAAIVQGPDESTQAKLIAQLEGAKIVAGGVLTVFGFGVQGAIQSTTDLATWTANQAKELAGDVHKVVAAATSPWLWGLLIAGLVGIVYIVANSAAGGALVSHYAPLRRKPEKATERRRRRAPRASRALEEWSDDHAGHSRAAFKGWHRRREKSERVVQNIPPDYEPLWRRVGGHFRHGTPHQRYEAFMQYAEEHPDEVVEALAIDAEASFEQQRQAAGF